MSGATVSCLSLPGIVVTGVAGVCILMAAAVAAFGIARRREGFDPMLVISAIFVVGLAVLVLLTR